MSKEENLLDGSLVIPSPLDQLEWDVPINHHEVTKYYKYLEKVTKNNQQRKDYEERISGYKSELRKIMDAFEANKGKVGVNSTVLESFYQQFKKIIVKIKTKEADDGKTRVLYTGLKKKIGEWLSIRGSRFPEEQQILEDYRVAYNILLSIPKRSRNRKGPTVDKSVHE